MNINPALLGAITLCERPHATPNTLAALVAHAYAAGQRRDDSYRDGTEAETAALEAAADEAYARVRAKLGEMGCDVHMLRSVIQ